MRRRAIALPVVLSVLTLMLIIVGVVASSGILNLQHARVDYFEKCSLYAAEAGIARSIREVIGGGSGAVSGTLADSKFTVEVTPGPSAGPPQVPANCLYLLATGTTGDRYPRRVGVLIRGLENGEATSSFPYVIATGGALSAHGGGRIAGSLKANQDITLGGGIKLAPVQGNGRLLSSANIEVQGGVKLDPTQDVRARMTADVRRAGPNVFSNDNTPASAPFIADGRFSNTLNTGEVGEVMPNPDPVALLGLTEDGLGDYLKDPLTGLYVVDSSRTDVVQHPETLVNGTLMLDDKIHFFPNGVTIDGVSGNGTIVSGNGNKITFNRQIRGFPRLNVLALRWKSQVGLGNPSIEFSVGKNEINGLILAHEDVVTRSNFLLNGMIVCYNPGTGDFQSDPGHRVIKYDPVGLLLPGFESWLTGGVGGVGGGLGLNLPVSILSWQRL